MGNTQGDYDPHFDAKQYLKPGIYLDEINCIRKSFLKFSPNDNGYVKTSVVLKTYKEAYQMDSLKKRWYNRSQINFNEFYEEMSNILIQRKNTMHDV